MQEFTVIEKPYGLKDRKGGLWVFFKLSEPWIYKWVAISRDYKSSDAPYIQERTVENVTTAMDEFATGHVYSPNQSQYFDKQGIPWIVVETGQSGNTHVAGTLGYYNNGAFVGGESEAEAKLAAEQVSAQAVKAGYVKKPPPVPPPPSEVDVPPAPPPPPPLGSVPLTSHNYKALGDMAVAIGARPADMLLVLYAESGLRTTAQAKDRNGDGIAFGINQMTIAGASAIGMSEPDWRSIPSLSFNDQVRITERFMRKVARSESFANAVNLYQTNFAPATVGGYTLYKSPSKGYSANAGYDFNQNGQIDTDDLLTVLRRRAGEQAFRDHLGKLQAAGFAGEPNLPSAGGFGMGGILIAAALGVGAFMLMGGSNSSSGSPREADSEDDDGDEA